MQRDSFPTSTVNALRDTLALCRDSIYLESRSELHDGITKSAWQWVKDRMVFGSEAPIIDLGCGSGPFLSILKEEDRECLGITFNKQEFEDCTRGGHKCLSWDMHNVSQLENFASGIWARHALEHSPAPLMLLRSCHAALKKGGWIYIEVPAPGTSSKHEENPNHFSVLGKLMWQELILRAGFQIVDTASVTFRTPLGEDEYYSFLAKR